MTIFTDCVKLIGDWQNSSLSKLLAHYWLIKMLIMIRLGGPNVGKRKFENIRNDCNYPQVDQIPFQQSSPNTP